MDNEPRALRAQTRPVTPAFPGNIVQASLAAKTPDFFDDAEQAGLPEEDGISTPAPGETRLTAQPLTHASADAGSDDPIWRRLEAISKAHREKASGPQPDRRPTATSEGRTEAPIQRQPQARQRPPQVAVPRAETPRRVPPAARAPVQTRLQPEPRARASSSGLNDDDWRRLEAISNAHRRKEQGENASQAPHESPAPIQRSTGEPAPQTARQETLSPIPAEASIQSQPATTEILGEPHPLEPAGSLPIQPQPDTAQPISGHLAPVNPHKPDVFRRIRDFLRRPPVPRPDTFQEQVPVILPQKQKLVAQTETPVIPPVPAHLPEQPAAAMETDPGDETEFKLPIGHEAEIQARRAEEKKAAPATEGKPVVERVAEPLPDDEPALDFYDPLEDEETASEETLTPQAQPLQKAWNVERQRPRQNESPAPTPAPVPLESATLDSIQPQQAVVQRLLDQVQPGQPSDSKVETLPPRKPRPVAPPVQPSAETEQFEASVQLQQAAAYTAQPSSILPEGFSEPAPEDSPVPVNVTAADSDPVWEEMVETPAGVLPASLASLLQGQASGTTEAAAEKTSVQKRPSSGSPLMPGDEHIVQRSPETSTAWSEISLPGAEPPTAVVQRTVEISEISAEPSSSPTSEGQAGEQANQPDIEELARKVYTEVKRKMAVERERNRR